MKIGILLKKNGKADKIFSTSILGEINMLGESFMLGLMPSELKKYSGVLGLEIDNYGGINYYICDFKPHLELNGGSELGGEFAQRFLNGTSAVTNLEELNKHLNEYDFDMSIFQGMFANIIMDSRIPEVKILKHLKMIPKQNKKLLLNAYTTHGSGMLGFVINRFSYLFVDPSVLEPEIENFVEENQEIFDDDVNPEGFEKFSFELQPIVDFVVKHSSEATEDIVFSIIRDWDEEGSLEDHHYWSPQSLKNKLIEEFDNLDGYTGDGFENDDNYSDHDEPDYGDVEDYSVEKYQFDLKPIIKYMFDEYAVELPDAMELLQDWNDQYNDYDTIFTDVEDLYEAIDDTYM